MDFNYVIKVYEQHLNNINLDKKSIKQYVNVITEFVEFTKEMGVSNLSELKGVHMDMYMSTLINKGNKPTTRSRKKSIINRFFSYCVRREILDKNPVEVLERVKITDLDKKPKKVLSEREKNNMYGKISRKSRNKTKNLAIFTVLLYGALRVSELCILKWEDIDFKHKNIAVKGKGRKKRNIPLVQEMEESLRAWKEEQPKGCEYIFTAKNGEKPMETRSVHGLVKHYTKSATNENGLGPHRLRATSATDYLREGVNLRYIQQLLGHESLATTQLYMSPEEMEVSAAIREAAKNMKRNRNKK